MAFWMSSTTTLLIVNLFTTQEFQASHAIAKDHSRIRQNLARSYQATTANSSDRPRTSVIGHAHCVIEHSDWPSDFCNHHAQMMWMHMQVHVRIRPRSTKDQHHRCFHSYCTQGGVLRQTLSFVLYTPLNVWSHTRESSLLP